MKKTKTFAVRCEMLLLWYGRMLVTSKVQMSKKVLANQSEVFV